MDDGSMVVFGASEYGEKDIPEATANEKIVKVKAYPSLCGSQRNRQRVRMGS